VSHRPKPENLQIRLASDDGADAQAWPTGVLGRSAAHKINRLHELLPWAYAQRR